MTDLTLDAILKAVRLLLFAEQLREEPCGECIPDCRVQMCLGCRLRKELAEVDALIAQRRGRPDDQPARTP